MSLTAADSGGGDFKVLPAGTHIATCYMIVDLGYQKTNWQGEENIKHQVYIAWEVPAERLTYTKDNVEHDGPMMIGNFYTLSLSEKANLRKHLEGWRGKAFTNEELNGFDITNVLGKSCQVSVINKLVGQNNRAYINGVVGLPKGMPAPDGENKQILYSPDDDRSVGLTDLPDWLQKKIGEGVSPKQTENRPASDGQDNQNVDFDDDIPF